MKALHGALGSALLVCCVSAVCAGDELDKKETKALERAVSVLEKAEAKLAEYEGEKHYSDRAGEGLERSLEQAQEKLAGLPPAGEGVGAASKRAEELSKRLRALILAKGSLGAQAFLGPKASANINTYDVQLKNFSAELEKYGADGKFDFNDRVKGRMQSQLQKLEEKLGEFPQDNVVVKSLVDRGKAARAELEAMSQDLGAALAARAKEEAERQALMDAPAFASDIERIGGLVETFKQTYLFTLDAGYLRNPLDGSTYEEALTLAGEWTHHAQTYRGLRAKYALFMNGRGSTSMMVSLREADEWLPRFEAAIQTFQAGAPGLVAVTCQQARALAQKAVADKNHRAFSDFIGELAGKTAYVRRVAELHAKLGGSGLASQAEALAKDLLDEQEKLAVDIVAGNRAPKDAYQGPDQAELEAFVRAQWAKHFADEEVVGVRFPNESFQRTVAWRWDSSKKQAYKVDQSELWIRVLVKSGDEALIYSCLLRRLHLDGDKLTIRWSRSKRVPPSERMLLANLD